VVSSVEACSPTGTDVKAPSDAHKSGQGIDSFLIWLPGSAMPKILPCIGSLPLLRTPFAHTTSGVHFKAKGLPRDEVVSYGPITLLNNNNSSSWPVGHVGGAWLRTGLLTLHRRPSFRAGGLGTTCWLSSRRLIIAKPVMWRAAFSPSTLPRLTTAWMWADYCAACNT